MKLKTERFLLVLLLGFAFIGLIAAMLILTVPESNQNQINILIGTLGTTFINAISHYFRSSTSGGSD